MKQNKRELVDVLRLDIHRDDESFVKESYSGNICEGVQTLLYHLVENPREYGLGDEVLKIEWDDTDGYLITYKWAEEIETKNLAYEYIDIYRHIPR